MAMVKLNKDEEAIVTLYERLKDGYREETTFAKRLLQVMTTNDGSFRILLMLIESLYRARKCNNMLSRLVRTNDIAAQYDQHLVEMMDA